jgi:hypothetical protein
MFHRKLGSFLDSWESGITADAVRGNANRFVIVDFSALHPELKAIFHVKEWTQISSDSSEPKEIVGFA